MQKSPIELSVILPAYNEAADIQANVRRLDQKLFALGITYEILIVNDGSQDRTLEKSLECRGPRIHVYSYDQNCGKGFAVRQGMRNAHGTYRLFMDVDLSTSLDAIEEFLVIMRKGGHDLLIGDRKSSPQHDQIKQPWLRRFLGRGFIRLSCWCVGRTFNDFTCGFKMFNQSAAALLFGRQRIFNWAFDTELLYIACRHGLRIGEIPVVWSHHPGSTVRPVKDVFTSLAGLWRIRANAWRGMYN